MKGGRDGEFQFLIQPLPYCLNKLGPHINFVIKNDLVGVRLAEGKRKGILTEEGTGAE